MAKEEFLRNLRTARNLVFHRVQTDHSGLDPETVEAQLERAAIWLTPSSVRGFDADDFPELPSEVRERLKQDVGAFVHVAEQVPRDKPATREQIEDAFPVFLRILTTLGPYFPTGGEVEQVRQALQQCSFPNGILNWEFELGDDSTGDPAVWLWLFVDDSTSAEDSAKMATEAQGNVHEALSGAGIARWPYIRFRTASEQRAL